jgi:hypothetical protein
MLVITPSTSVDAFIVMPLIVAEPFSVRFSATKVASASAKQCTFPNLPVWVAVFVIINPAGY